MYRLGLPRDSLVEALELLRHGRGDSRVLQDGREGGGDRPDGFLVAVEVSDDAPFALRELPSEHFLYRRPSRGGALVLAPCDFVPQARDVLPKARVLGLDLFELLQLLADFEQELSVRLHTPVQFAVR